MTIEAPTHNEPAADPGPSMPFYNLVDEAWIPVVLVNGASEQLSIIEVFSRAQEIRHIGGELPTMQPAILRVLIAVLASAVKLPSDPKDWAERIGDWAAVTAAVTTYLEQHRERFWLSHPSEPFFQVADLGPATGETKSLAVIVADFPANVAAFTQRGPKSLLRIHPSEAARWLIHTQAYDTSGIKTPDRRDPRAKNGKVYPLGTAWGGKGEVLVASGDNLAQTLSLNLVAPASTGNVSGPDDLPPWERPHPGALPEFGDDATPAGFLQVYTWQARRIRLIFEEDAVVSVTLCYGDALAEQNRNAFDPMMTWRYSAPQTKRAGETVYMPGIVDPSKAAWRSLTSWLPTRAHKSAEGKPQFLEPGVLKWIGDLKRAGVLGLEFKPNIAIFGVEFGPQSATYKDLLDDSLTVPPFLLREDAIDAGITVLAAIDDADATAWYLGTFAANLAQARGVAPADTPRHEARQSSYMAFGELFARWLSELSERDEWLAARTEWQKRLRQAAENLADTLADEAGTGAMTGRIIDTEKGTWLNLAIATKYLERGMRKTLPLAYKENTHGTSD